MPTPSYRDTVAPSLIDTSIPDSGNAGVAEQLANTFKTFANRGAQMVGDLRAEQGRREGAEAGRTDNPAFRSGASSLTAYGRAYNDSAMRSYTIKSEIAADEAATRLETEAGNDPEHFKAAFGARRDETLKNAPPEARAVLGEVYDRRMAAGMQRLIEKQSIEMKQAARADVSEGLKRSTDRLAQLRASDDPALQAQADEEQVKIDLLINGAVNDGTLSETEAGVLRIDSARSSVEQTVMYRFKDELDNPYGDPVGFITRLQEYNKTSEVLPPDEEEKLQNSLLTELREHNSLRSAARTASDNEQKVRWGVGDRTATSMLLEGRLNARTIQKMVDDDELDPSVARTLYNELQSGNDRPDDSKERFRVETTLLKQTEEEIAKNDKLSWTTRRELIAKRREQAQGWRGTQEAREAASRIDRALGILPGTNPKTMNADELQKADKALTEWYNEVDSLPPDKRQGAIITSAENVISKIIRAQALSDADRLREKIAKRQARMQEGKLDEQQLKDAQAAQDKDMQRLKGLETAGK